ncbi:MAG: aldo/keto reductase family oxidoreductase [Pseudomonadales bacterium]
MTNLIDPRPRAIAPELTVGPIGYGCWRLVAMSPADAQLRLEQAIAQGINLIDTADVYGLDWGGSAFGESEALLGLVLKQAPGLRGNIVLASKGGIVPGVPYDSRNLIASCEASLTRLGVEQIDLYQIHRPDLLAHPEQVAAQLSALRETGKIQAVGVSNHRPSQTAALQHFLDFPIATQQPQYSAAHLTPLFDGTFDQCLQLGQTALCWSPLAGGRLATGTDVAPALLAVLDRLAERESVSRSTIALGFTLAHPSNPVTLIGSIDPARIAESKAVLSVQLDATDIYALIEASMGESLP